jgi:hypothetical protein
MTASDAARPAFVVGAASALVVVAGFAVVGPDWDGTAYDIGLVLVVLGTAGLFLGGFTIQLRAGILALRRGVSPAAPVIGATVALCSGATALFALGWIALAVAGHSVFSAD